MRALTRPSSVRPTLDARARRTVLVVAGLTLAGACTGALAGSAVAMLVAAYWGGWTAITDPYIYSFGSAFGAAGGTVLAPLASFAFLRHVPLWRLFAETAVGTVVGAVAASLLEPALLTLSAGATMGFLAAAGRLAWRAPLSVSAPARTATASRPSR